jgi:phosphoglycolate phosphatase-like HAD superfamily hydrolase
MKLETILFDWSGTISNDFEPVLNSINYVLRNFEKNEIGAKFLRNNYQANPCDLYTLCGVRADSSRINGLFKENLVKEKPAVLIDGAKETLQHLHSKGIGMYIVSSHPILSLLGEIERYGLSHIFPQHKVIGDSANKADSILSLKLNGSSAIVGDTHVDIEAGKKLGIKTIAVLSDYESKNKLMNYSPTCLLKSIRELPGILE